MKIRTYTVWFIILTFVAGFAFNGNGTVLCVESSGRFKVEPVCEPCCNNDANELYKLHFASSYEYQAGYENHTGCANCTDLLLNRYLLTHRSGRVSHSMATVALDTSSPFTKLEATTVIPFTMSLFKRDSNPFPANVFLSTTILRR